MLPAVCDGFLNLIPLGDGLFDLRGQFRQRNGRQLNVEPLQQLSLVAHGGPEVKGAGADLQNANAAEGLDHTAYRQEVPHTALKYGIIQPAVGQVCKGNLEPAQHLAGGKQTALGIPQANAVGLRTLIQRPPQQNGDIQVLGKSGADVLCTKVAVGEQNTVDACFPELGKHLQPVLLAVKQTFFVDIIDINEINIQFLEPLPGQVRVLDGIRCREDTASGGNKAQNNTCHRDSSSFFIFWLYYKDQFTKFE